LICDLGDAIEHDPEVRQARRIADAARKRLVVCMTGSQDAIDPREAQRMLDAFRSAVAHAEDAEDRVLLHRGADVDARDETWDSHPVVWAAIGSSEQHDLNPHPDWAGTVQALLEAGANAADVTLSPDEDHQPSPEVAALLKQATITGR